MRNQHRSQHKITGLTLLEILLVLVIATSILLVGLRQYQTSQAEQTVQQLKYNVDQLLESLNRFYQINCRDRRDNTGAMIPKTGALSPTSLSYPPTAEVPVSLAQLKTEKYLPANVPTLNPLVQGYVQGYILQFNPSSAMRNITTCWPTGAANTPCVLQSATPMNVVNPSIQNNNMIIWRVQVAVLLQPQYDPATYKSLLAADCLSTLAGNGNTVVPCASSGNTGNYIVWERLPSSVSPQTTSALWPSIPYLKEFNLQYTHDPMYELGTDPLNATQESTASEKYYLCGG